MPTKDKKKKSSKVHVDDLSKVDAARKSIPEGRYHVRVSNATAEKGQDSGEPYIKMEFIITEGKCKGTKLWDNSSLQPTALFHLKSVLQALAYDIPKKAFDIDTKELIDLECDVEVSHEMYEGKKKNVITEFLNPDDDEDEDEDDDEDEDEDEGDDEDEDEDEDLEDRVNALSLKDMKRLADEVGISEAKIKKCGKDKAALAGLILTKDEDDVQEALDEIEE